MYEYLLKLWREGKISVRGLENALEKGWISSQEKESIERDKAK